VQFAGRLPDYGVEILFRCLAPEDLNREIIKSEHCSIEMEELELTIPPAKRAEITTIESLLLRAHEDLLPTLSSQPALDEDKLAKLNSFLAKLKAYSEGKHFPLTLKLRDPSGNSNIKNPFAPRIDKHMKIRSFKRTKEELLVMGYNPDKAEEEMQHECEAEFKGDKLNFVRPFEESDMLTYEPVSF
jgi:zinc finger protein